MLNASGLEDFFNLAQTASSHWMPIHQNSCCKSIPSDCCFAFVKTQLSINLPAPIR
jgi:hypothetical protein